MTQQSLAEAIDVSPGFISDISNGKKVPSIEVLDRILAALDADISEIASSLPPTAVPGQVGAGDDVLLTDEYAKGDGMYHVETPQQLAGQRVVAVEIKGDSMMPTYQAGGIVFYTRDTIGVPTEAEFRICVAQDAAGSVWLKQVKPSSDARGLYDLISLNRDVAPMYGRKLKWAAPILFYLPPEFVTRIG